MGTWGRGPAEIPAELPFPAGNQAAGRRPRSRLGVVVPGAGTLFFFFFFNSVARGRQAEVWTADLGGGGGRGQAGRRNRHNPPPPR